MNGASVEGQGLASATQCDRGPLVTVVIPTYQRAAFVKRAVERVQRQVYGNLEIIVVDDGSTDRTESVIANFRDPRVRYVRHERNRGVSAARNTGIREARGEYIAFLDDDDDWREDKVETQVRALARQEVVVCMGVAGGKPTRAHAKSWITPDDLREGTFHPSALMAKSAVLKEVMFDETLTQGEDWDLFIRISQRCPIGWIDEPLLSYNSGGHERATNAAKRLSPEDLEERTTVLRKHREFLGEKWFRYHLARTLLTYIGTRKNKYECIAHAVSHCGWTPVVAVLLSRIHLKWKQARVLGYTRADMARQDSKRLLKGHALGGKDGSTAKILLVPGFVADTYSEIERSFVELCAKGSETIQFVWLVPNISYKHNRFVRADKRESLLEPVWVPHLRRLGVPYIVADVSKYNLVHNFFLFREIFRKHRIDAVYTHFGFERFWATFFGRLLGRVTIWNEHWHSLGRSHRWLKRIFYHLFVDEFISVSKFITGTLPNTFRVHTIPNAVYPTPTSRTLEIEALRLQIGIGDEEKLVLMVAAFRPEKRHILALEICRQVMERRTDVLFLFLGEGPMRDEFTDRVRELGLAKRIISLGHVDNVDDYYAIADISMLTSQSEPFGYVVLEAMQWGLPVVAFESGAPAEIIRDGETGFLVKDGDADAFTRRMLTLIDNRDLRLGVGQAARRAVQSDYNRDQWITRLNSTLKETVMARGHEDRTRRGMNGSAIKERNT